MVVVYHMNPSLLPGGFVGVDMFFVISGFVVSLSLFNRQCDSVGDFLLGFFARRAKRLLPSALIVVCTCAAALSAVVPPEMGPQALKYLKVALAGLLGNANTWLYYSADSYLDDAENSQQMNPFLHLWSLGVEEQYYLVYPFLVLVGLGSQVAKGAMCSPSQTRLATLLCVCLVASVVVCGAVGRHDQDAAFYLLPPRLWELVAGAGLALLSQQLRFVEMVQASCVSALLQLLAVGSVMLCALLPYNKIIGFPFPGAIIPVLSALCYIAAGSSSHSSANALLATPIPAYIGRLSYCIYLWHTPILAVLHWRALDMTDGRFTALLALSPWLMMLLAAATYHYVEVPIRSVKASNSMVFLCSGLGMCGGALWVACLVWVRTGLADARPVAFGCGLAIVAALVVLLCWVHRDSFAKHRRHLPILLLVLAIVLFPLLREGSDEGSSGSVTSNQQDVAELQVDTADPIGEFNMLSQEPLPGGQDQPDSGSDDAQHPTATPERAGPSTGTVKQGAPTKPKAGPQPQPKGHSHNKPAGPDPQRKGDSHDAVKETCVRTPCMCRQSSTLHTPPAALPRSQCPGLALPECLAKSKHFTIQELPQWSTAFAERSASAGERG